MLKRLALIFTFFLLCGSLQAQGYFCSRKGARLEYVRKYADSGKLRWRHVMTVTGVTADGTVTTTSDFLKANGKLMYSVVEKTDVDADGNVSLDMGKALASYISARTHIDAEGWGDPSVLPADIQPGDTLACVESWAKVGPLKYTVRIYSRQVLRRETVSVPAGTFDCLVVREMKDESGPGHNRLVMNDSWYCKDVGYVRHDTYDRDGKLETTEILQSIQ